MMVQTVANLLLLMLWTRFSLPGKRINVRRVAWIRSLCRSRVNSKFLKGTTEKSRAIQSFCSGRGQSRLWMIAHKRLLPLTRGRSLRVHMADKRGEALKSNLVLRSGDEARNLLALELDRPGATERSTCVQYKNRGTRISSCVRAQINFPHPMLNVVGICWTLHRHWLHTLAKRTANCMQSRHRRMVDGYSFLSEEKEG